MISIPHALEGQAKFSASKAESLRETPGAFVVSGFFGGAYIGVGVVLMVSAAGPLLAAGDPFTKLISGVVFSAALILVVFAGAELITSTMMTATQGVLMRGIGWGPANAIFWVTFAANFVGSLIFSAIVAVSGVLKSNAAAGAMIASLLAVKAEESPMELLMRGILCNMLVCLAVWMGLRVKSTGTKIAVIVAAITAFVASGFEHVVANMTIYWLGVFAGDPLAGTQYFAQNMLFVGLGNMIGGGIIVGAGYWLLGRRDVGSREPVSKREV